ncbi:hypothetical protein CTC_00808 [Clostridium tetani E88]|uniref:Uncharacterized protein n=1 Tax=Clostridium tetani (strain Massachusetts / E88) TaxID=212717 RepID=Q897D2_CLOTE|nr:hypothetical protein CTC_00808 [Clostridium tetani E88]
MFIVSCSLKKAASQFFKTETQFFYFSTTIPACTSLTPFSILSPTGQVFSINCANLFNSSSEELLLKCILYLISEYPGLTSDNPKKPSASKSPSKSTQKSSRSIPFCSAKAKATIVWHAPRAHKTNSIGFIPLSVPPNSSGSSNKTLNPLEVEFT